MKKNNQTILYWDHALGHTANFIQSLLFNERITVILVLGSSPEMDPIERVFGQTTHIIAEWCCDCLGLLGLDRLHCVSAAAFTDAAIKHGNRTILGLWKVYHNVRGKNI